MSCDSTSKPKFPLWSLVRYVSIGGDVVGEGYVVGAHPLVGDGSLTLTVRRLDGRGLVQAHESWCSLVEYMPCPTQDSPEVEEAVIEEIRRRRDAGRKKYGTTMERDDLTIEQWVVHAKEEALDFAIYLEKLKREIAERGDYHRLRGDETLGTFGGEYWSDCVDFSEYGIDLGVASVHGVSPKQAIALACTLVNHLVRNGHDFELRKGTHQDQRMELVCLEEGEK